MLPFASAVTPEWVAFSAVLAAAVAAAMFCFLCVRPQFNQRDSRGSERRATINADFLVAERDRICRRNAAWIGRGRMYRDRSEHLTPRHLEARRRELARSDDDNMAIPVRHGPLVPVVNYGAGVLDNRVIATQYVDPSRYRSMSILDIGRGDLPGTFEDNVDTVGLVCRFSEGA